MKEPEHLFPSFRKFDVKGDISKQMVSAEDVLMMCTYIGKQLQGIPKAGRKLHVSRFLNKSDALRNEGIPFAAAMLTFIASSWDDFEQ